MNSRLTISGFFLSLLFAIATLLSGCGGGGASSGTTASGTGTTTTGTTTTGTTTTATTVTAVVSAAKNISLAKITTAVPAAPATSVKTDDSDEIIITATVIDANNAVLSGESVSFKASTGILSAATATTDASGKATVRFHSGTIEKVNRTATITASVSGTTPALAGTIPVQITGSTLTLTTTPPSSSIIAGAPATLTATLRDAGVTPVASQTVRFSIAASSTGSGTLSAASATTNASGVGSISFTGTAVGQVDVLAEWLDSSGAATMSSTQTFTVAAAAGTIFQVTAPTSPFAVTLGTTQSIVVNVPASIGSTAVANIRFATTLGAWSNGLKVLTVSRTTPTETQVFSAGIYAGNANVQIDALDAGGAVISSAKLVLALSAPATSAFTITLHSSASAIAQSSGGTASTATLTATVKDVNGNAVGNAPVLFELVNSTGTGEQLDPVVALTSATGKATATFTAGTVSTVQTPNIKVSVISNPTITATANITVGGTAGSIAIGTSSTIASVNQDSVYSLPVTVLVTDSNGNAVSGAVITLSVWPKYYYKGYRGALCAVTRVGGDLANNNRYINEDLNENFYLDPGEDIDGPGGAVSAGFGAVDGILWPPAASGGSVPVTVTTGTDGTATFSWTYPKQYADWVEARFRARTEVLGSEATSEILLVLTRSAGDSIDPCPLSNSPFN